MYIYTSFYLHAQVGTPILIKAIRQTLIENSFGMSTVLTGLSSFTDAASSLVSWLSGETTCEIPASIKTLFPGFADDMDPIQAEDMKQTNVTDPEARSRQCKREELHVRVIRSLQATFGNCISIAEPGLYEAKDTIGACMHDFRYCLHLCDKGSKLKEHYEDLLEQFGKLEAGYVEAEKCVIAARDEAKISSRHYSWERPRVWQSLNPSGQSLNPPAL